MTKTLQAEVLKRRELAAIGARLRDRRKKMDKGFRQLAREADVSTATLGRHELGEVACKLSDFLAYCRVLHISPNDLTGWKDRRK